jgi:hypothetical protein
MATALANFFVAAYSAVNKKDWDTTQRTAFEETVFSWVNLLLDSNIKALERRFAPAITQDDTTTYWTQGTWDLTLQALVNLRMSVPRLALEIAKAVLYYVKIRDPDPVRSIPGAYYLPYRSILTGPGGAGTTFSSVVDTIRADQGLAALHAAKTEMTMVPLTLDMLVGLNTEHVLGSDINWDMWLSQHTAFRYRVGGADSYATCIGNAVGAFITNTGNSFTLVPILWVGEEIPDYWAITPMLTLYNLNVNDYGLFYGGGNLTNNFDLGFEYATLASTSWTQVTTTTTGVCRMISTMFPTVGDIGGPSLAVFDDGGFVQVIRGSYTNPDFWGIAGLQIATSALIRNQWIDRTDAWLYKYGVAGSGNPATALVT